MSHQMIVLLRRGVMLVVGVLAVVLGVLQVVHNDRISLYPEGNRAANEAVSASGWVDGDQVLIRIGQAELTAEIAATRSAQAKGLSGRESLPAGSGLLFVYDELGIPVFWMLDMRFAIDIIWIAGGVVRDITAEIPAPESGVSEESLSRYSPNQPVDQVLEVPAGWATAQGVAPGDSVTLVRSND